MSLLDWLFRRKNAERRGDTVNCPACEEPIGSRRELRQQVGAFQPSASIGINTRCPHCDAEVYLSL